jgi:two-component system, cell cycle response regulator CtrA
MSVELPAPVEALNGQTAGRPAASDACDNEVRDSGSIDYALTPRVIETGNLRVNLDTKTVDVRGQRVHLTGMEYEILELLSLLKGTTLTKEMVLNHLYGGMNEPGLKIIDVFVCKLRKKLQAATGGKHCIETVWGRGYMLRDLGEEGSEAA